jgi:tryptophan synthase beta chain
MSIAMKFCGLTRAQDVLAAAEAGARYMGLVFFAKSPRNVSLEAARELAMLAPPGLAKVALTVDANDATLDALMSAVPLDMLQLHGSESPERVTEVRARTGLPVMKAIGIAEAEDLSRIDIYSEVADQILIDAKPPKTATLPGGNGLSFDWRLLAGRKYWTKPWMLAGGLTPDNVAEAVRLTGRATGGPQFRHRKRAGGEGPGDARRHTQQLHDRPRREGPVRRFRRAVRVRTLMPLILELEAQYENAKTDESFWAEMDDLWKHYVGRPSPALFRRTPDRASGRRQDLPQARRAEPHRRAQDQQRAGPDHPGAPHGQDPDHRRNRRGPARRGDGHGLRQVRAEMHRLHGRHDVERQAPNVFRMKLLGAEVVPVTSGRGTLKDAMNDALRDWVTNVRDTFYCIGTVAGPHPYPAMVRDFQSIIGKEAKGADHGRRGPPARHDHRRDRRRLERDGPVLPVPRRQGGRIIGVEAGGKGVNEKMEHCASLTGGRPGVLHGNRTYLCRTTTARSSKGTRSRRGSTIPASGRSMLAARYRAGEYVSITDAEALEAFQLSCETEGIIPALEPSHALAHVAKIAPDLPCRGDKDFTSSAA